MRPDLIRASRSGDDAMAFQAVSDAAEIVITYSQNSILHNNVLAASKSGGYNLADLVVLATAVNQSVVDDWLPLQTNECSYQQTLVRGLAFLNDQETIVTTGAGPGGVASKGLPSNVTFSVKKGSGLTGRNARGRAYWIGIPSAALAGNENLLISTEADDIVAAMEAMRLAITATVWTAAIVSRFLNGALRDPGKFFEWTECSSVDDQVDTQRRRLP